MYIYAFPPFNMIRQTISKISGESEKNPTLMWPAQTYFTRALNIVIGKPLFIPNRHLQMPGTQKCHPLHPKLDLLVLLSLGEKEKEYQVDFPKILQNLYSSMVTTNKTKIHVNIQNQENMCNKRDVNIFQADEIIALQVVTQEYQRGLNQLSF